MHNEDIAGITIPILIALTIISLIVTPIVESAIVDGKADFCYLQQHYTNTGGPNPQNEHWYRLEAHRPWRSDMVVASFPTFNEAIEGAKNIKCPLFTEAK
jgi:hypothetical protein